MGRVWVVLGVLLWALCLDPRSACSQTRHTAIALVSGGANAELHARLRAELAGLGWRVSEVSLGGDLALAQVARRARTLAVLRVGRAAEGIEIWVAPEVDSEARSEWVDVDPKRPELAVLRAVEALRARFIELGIEPEDREPEPSESDSTSAPTNDVVTTAQRRAAEAGSGSKKPPGRAEDGPELTDTDASALPAPPSAPDAPRAPHALWLGLRGGLVSASRDLGASGALSGGLRYVRDSWFGADLSFWWPPAASRVHVQEGDADVRAALAALGVEARDRRGAWTLVGGGGLALVSVRIDGHAQTKGYRNNSTSVLTTMPFARLAAELELVYRLHLRLEGALGIAAQRAVAKFDQNTVVVWGRPVLAVSLGFEWAALGN